MVTSYNTPKIKKVNEILRKNINIPVIEMRRNFSLGSPWRGHGIMLGSTAAWGQCVGPHLSPVAHLGMARAHSLGRWRKPAYPMQGHSFALFSPELLNQCKNKGTEKTKDCTNEGKPP